MFNELFYGVSSLFSLCDEKFVKALFSLPDPHSSFEKKFSSFLNFSSPVYSLSLYVVITQLELLS